jgi:hypothetical protein
MVLVFHVVRMRNRKPFGIAAHGEKAGLSTKLHYSGLCMARGSLRQADTGLQNTFQTTEFFGVDTRAI